MTDMPDILARICAQKRVEIDALDRAEHAEFRAAAERQSPPRGFRAALAADDTVALIAEVKKASPSAGVIRPDFDAVDIAQAYARAGATCVSVLTDRPFFQGDPSYLAEIHACVALPLLRKDFILDPVQIVQARALGADACLLIAAALDPPQLRELHAAVDAHGMDALVEVHNEAELQTALDAGADLIGINNRNLHTFEVSLQVTERLAALVPDGVVLVSESGIKSRQDIAQVKACGVDAVLVGQSLVEVPDVEAAARRFVGV
jgi:indole-3-glycerol phosphate synthase